VVIKACPGLVNKAGERWPGGRVPAEKSLEERPHRSNQPGEVWEMKSRALHNPGLE
jgi:hypothetical protein